MSDKKTTSFIRSLCMGQIEQDVLFPFPALTTDQKATLHEIAAAVESLLSPRAEEFRQWDVAGDMPTDFIEELGQFGLFGLIIPEAYGGMGLGGGSVGGMKRLIDLARHIVYCTDCNERCGVPVEGTGLDHERRVQRPDQGLRCAV